MRTRKRRAGAFLFPVMITNTYCTTRINIPHKIIILFIFHLMRRGTAAVARRGADQFNRKTICSPSSSSSGDLLRIGNALPTRVALSSSSSRPSPPRLSSRRTQTTSNSLQTLTTIRSFSKKGNKIIFPIYSHKMPSSGNLIITQS